jgi:hypothetical protein
MVSDGLFEIADSAPGKNRVARIPYAAAAWHCQALPDKEEARISVAWSVPLANFEFRSGVTSFRTKFPTTVQRSEAFLPFVEEPLGVMYHRPSPAEEEWNAHLERLVADYLLFFIHRVFFGQCQKMWPALAPFKDNVDNVLILGPTLPKFRGRVCYSHFSRSKTLAVIAADTGHGLPPDMGCGQWTEEPSPPFWYDYSARCWKLNGEQNDRLGNRCKSFEIVIPTGDGFSGKLYTNGTAGTSLWREKFEKVKHILDTERESVRLGMWSNREVFLPKGLAQAVRVLALADAVRTANVRKAQILKSASEEEKQLAATVGRRAPMADRDTEQPNIHPLVLCRAIETYTKRRASPPVADARRLASRDMGDYDVSVDLTFEDIKKEFGANLMSYSIHSLHEKA